MQRNDNVYHWICRLRWSVAREYLSVGYSKCDGTLACLRPTTNFLSYCVVLTVPGHAAIDRNECWRPDICPQRQRMGRLLLLCVSVKCIAYVPLPSFR